MNVFLTQIMNLLIAAAPQEILARELKGTNINDKHRKRTIATYGRTKRGN